MDTRYCAAVSWNVTDSKCEASQHCLALGCSFNQVEPLHLTHMLEMWIDEPLDDETAGIVGTEGTVEALVKFADKMNEALPEELHKRNKILRR